MSDETPACSERVRVGASYRQCTRKSVVERDGRPYCNRHDPEAAMSRRAVAIADYKAKLAAMKDHVCRERAAVAAVEGIPTEALEAGVVAGMREVVELLTAGELDVAGVAALAGKAMGVMARLEGGG